MLEGAPYDAAGKTGTAEAVYTETTGVCMEQDH